MKKATNQQIISLAKMYAKIGCNDVCLYAIDGNGDKKKFAAKTYRDTFHILTKEGILKYNGDNTYSIA